MLLRTHLALSLFAALFLIPEISSPILFTLIVLIATILPDIDSMDSTAGHNKIFRPLQWITKHRGFIHSLTLCIIFSAIISLFIPIVAFPFFIGYTVHLLADSLTIDGIRPFWPMKTHLHGKIRTGGSIEIIIFTIFIFLDFFLAIRLLF